MTRKEMIESIAKQAGCSKRLVRKKLFQLSAWHKRRGKPYPRGILFNEAFLDKTTNWSDYQDLHQKWKKDCENAENPWRVMNRFEVAAFPSGVVVLFHVNERYTDSFGEFITPTGECGCRLYRFKWDR